MVAMALAKVVAAEVQAGEVNVGGHTPTIQCRILPPNFLVLTGG